MGVVWEIKGHCRSLWEVEGVGTMVAGRHSERLRDLQLASDLVGGRPWFSG